MSKERPIILDPPAGDPYRYRVRWYDHVGRKRQATFVGHDEKSGKKAHAAAKRKVDELIGKMARGLRTNAQRATVEQLFDEWWENIVEPNIAPKTANDSYGPACQHRILPYLGDAEIGSVDRKTVQGFVAWMAKPPRSCSPTTITNTLTALSSMFAAAVEWDYLAVNPVHGVKRPDVPDADRQAYEPGDIYAMAAGMRFDRDRAMTVLVGFTGLRQSDAFGLEWRNVNEAADEPHIRVYRSKAKRWDDVPLLEPAVRALAWWRAASPSTDGLVFPSELGTSLMRQKSAWHRRCWRPGVAMAGMLRCARASCGAPVPATVSTSQRLAVDPRRGAERWKAWHERQAAGVRMRGPKPVEPWACPQCGEREVVGPVFHELRHSFASIAVAATGDASQVAEWGGWTSTRMLEQRYKKQLQRGRARAVAQVNDLVRDWS